MHEINAAASSAFAQFSIWPLLILGAYLLLNLWVVKSNLRISHYDEFATANRSVGFAGISLAIYSSWHVSAVYTAWAGFAIGKGFIAFYVLVYGLFGLATLMLIARKSFLWGKKYGCRTQGEMMGLRYQSRSLKAVLGISGIVLSIPWLFMEFVTMGISIQWASAGAVPAWAGVLVGVILVSIFIGMGGMKAAITAAIMQGAFEFFVACGLMIYLVYSLWGGFGALFTAVHHAEPALLSYPGPGMQFPVKFWTSIIVTSSLGSFMWPWIYNKILAADSIRSIKIATLGAPVLVVITWALFVFLGMGVHLLPQGAAKPQEGYFFVHSLGGPLVLGLFVSVVMAHAISTVSAIVQAIATHVTVDLVELFGGERVSEARALHISRITVVVSCVLAFLMSMFMTIDKLIFWALFTYQGMVLFWPVVVLGMWWKRANAMGALIALVGGLTISWGLTLLHPAFVAENGWTEGMYASIFAFAAMFVCGYLKKPAPYVDHLFDDTDGTLRHVSFERVPLAEPDAT
ncbi:sodium:solute symporter family protein [Burkholderia pseudomallei]|uniref:sodium:solute symporter family protein n=1 Tax=Burkholderia pseudomallei TaxID=28450 RepID=UPI00052AC407|nr:sodium:solute symporter family protein [Burkholderia pseudomallei]AIV63719.1 solute symporter family protein [Burkholderia pseudomallei K42]